MSTEKLKRAVNEARDYVGMVGKEQPHLRSLGYIHKISVSTQIHHQRAPSAQNYWESASFDAALSKVILQHWHELSAQAIQSMEVEYRNSLIAEKGELLAKLKQIEALEQEQA